jgi:hypothetical protein
VLLRIQIDLNKQQHGFQHCCSIACNAGYELLCFAQQDFKIVHYYYPALLAMLKDEIYFLLHLQQHGRM